MPIFKVRRRKLALRVEDVMSTPPITVSSKTIIKDAARLMYDNRIGCLPIVDSEGKLVGIVTERDMLFALSRSYGDMQVWQIMSENPITIAPGASIMEAIEKMRDANVRHLPVVNGENRPVGVVSLRDIVDVAMLFLRILAAE